MIREKNYAALENTKPPIDEAVSDSAIMASRKLSKLTKRRARLERQLAQIIVEQDALKAKCVLAGIDSAIVKRPVGRPTKKPKIDSETAYQLRLFGNAHFADFIDDLIGELKETGCQNSEETAFQQVREYYEHPPSNATLREYYKRGKPVLERMKKTANTRWK